MKNTLTNAKQDKDGVWWYIQPRGTRQRAKVKICLTCRSEFLGYPNGGSKYCSSECYRKVCARCNIEFIPKTARQMYCSLACKRGSGICENCGKSYVFSHHGAKRFCSTKCFYATQTPIGATIQQSNGYVLVKVPPGTNGAKKAKTGYTHWMLEHRFVMQQKIGRALQKNENVHHINGVRNDNRPENLELWKKSQPCGVRSSDYHCSGCACLSLPRG